MTACRQVLDTIREEAAAVAVRLMMCRYRLSLLSLLLQAAGFWRKQWHSPLRGHRPDEYLLGKADSA